MKRPKTTLFISLPGGAQRKKVAFYLFIFILFCIQLNSTFLWFHARYLQNEKKKKDGFDYFHTKGTYKI